MGTKHTPTPWVADIQEPYGSSLLDSNGIKIGFCSPMHHKPVIGAKGEMLPHAANATFIVRACNAHEELVAAAMKFAAGGWDGLPTCTYQDFEALILALRKARGEA